MCVCVSGGPATVPHTPTAGLGGQMLTLHPPQSLTPPAVILSFHPGEEGERRGGGLFFFSRKGTAKSIEGGSSLVSLIISLNS